MGVRTVRKDDNLDISLIYGDGDSFYEGGQEAPIAYLYWEGWEDSSRIAGDTLTNLSIENIEDAGRALTLSLIILGRETNY
jgi:hypothetical protein